MRKSSLVASTDPRYASTGTVSHPVAFPLRRALMQTLSSSSSRTSSSADRLSMLWCASAAGRWNLVPRNFSHSLSSCVDVVSGPPVSALGWVAAASSLPCDQVCALASTLHAYCPRILPSRYRPVHRGRTAGSRLGWMMTTLCAEPNRETVEEENYNNEDENAMHGGSGGISFISSETLSQCGWQHWRR